jgi:Fic-DOC domain mobile mystery protein B
MEFIYPAGATPLDHDAKMGLIPPLTTQRQLNAFEQANISSAIEWALKSRKLKETLVTIDGIKTLHGRMFNQTWKWAGKFRQRELNMGVEWAMIAEQVKLLCDDVSYWEQNSVFNLNEIAVRFHHRLVQIHPFPNGNGRVSRLAADLFIGYRDQAPLPWGRSVNLATESADRREYIDSLREADGGIYTRLIRFAAGGI